MTIYSSLSKLLLLSLLSLLIACIDQQDEAAAQEVIAYLALGDSYTIGQGVEENERWPNQLSERLEKEGFELEQTDIIAQTGWTTRDLLTAIEQAELGDYNLVSLLIGVNNQYRQQPFDLFESEFDLLLDKSIAIAGSLEKVFVVSIPDYGLTPFGSNNSAQIAMDIDRYNTYMAQKCDQQSIPFINITEISRDLGNSSGALASDQLHPSGSQYTAWVEKILPIVRERLSK